MRLVDGASLPFPRGKYYSNVIPTFQIFTLSIDAIDVTSVTLSLSCLNSTNATNATVLKVNGVGCWWCIAAFSARKILFQRWMDALLTSFEGFHRLITNRPLNQGCPRWKLDVFFVFSITACGVIDCASTIFVLG